MEEEGVGTMYGVGDGQDSDMCVCGEGCCNLGAEN